MTDHDWLTLDDTEEMLWSGNPRIQRILGIKFTDYIVTTQAVYRKSGIFSRNVQKIGLDKIQNISFSQGLLGKEFGYGNVDISTAGGSGVEMRFLAVDNPKEVQELINKHIRRDEESGSGKSTMEKILDEMKKVRESVENIEEKMSEK